MSEENQESNELSEGEILSTDNEDMTEFVNGIAQQQQVEEEVKLEKEVHHGLELLGVLKVSVCIWIHLKLFIKTEWGIQLQKLQWSSKMARRFPGWTLDYSKESTENW